MQAKEEELQSAKQENIATQGASEQLRVEVQTNQKMLDDLKKEMNIVQDLLTDQQEKTQVATEAKDKVKNNDTLL